MYEDRIIVGNLQWEMAAAKEEKEKRESQGKRSYRKARERLPTHRYPTPYSDSDDDKPLEIGWKEYEKLEEKIKTLEEAAEETRKEEKELREKLAENRTLIDQITALETALENFKMIQVKVNLNAIHEIARIHHLTDNNLTPSINRQAREITDLQGRYQVLAGSVNVLLSQQYARKPTPRKTPPAPNHSSSGRKRTPMKSNQLPPLRNILDTP